MKLKRIEAGVYETPDGKYRVMRWSNEQSNGKTTWAVAEWDGKGWDFVCEVETLADGRKYPNGENVFILS